MRRALLNHGAGLRADIGRALLAKANWTTFTELRMPAELAAANTNKIRAQTETEQRRGQWTLSAAVLALVASTAIGADGEQCGAAPAGARLDAHKYRQSVRLRTQGVAVAGLGGRRWGTGRTGGFGDRPVGYPRTPRFDSPDACLAAARCGTACMLDAEEIVERELRSASVC